MGLFSRFTKAANRNQIAITTKGDGFIMTEYHLPQRYEWSDKVTVEIPNITSDKLPFKRRGYACRKRYCTDLQMKSTELKDTAFLADYDAVVQIHSDISGLEKLINELGINKTFLTLAENIMVIPPIPDESFDFSHAMQMTVYPLTKSGKTPKNVINVSLDATDADMNGVIWHIDYMNDGRVNKADAHYWMNKTRYSFRIRRDKQGIAVIRATITDNDGDDVVLYEKD